MCDSVIPTSGSPRPQVNKGPLKGLEHICTCFQDPSGVCNFAGFEYQIIFTHGYNYILIFLRSDPTRQDLDKLGNKELETLQHMAAVFAGQAGGLPVSWCVGAESEHLTSSAFCGAHLEGLLQSPRPEDWKFQRQGATLESAGLLVVSHPISVISIEWCWTFYLRHICRFADLAFRSVLY